MAEKPFATGRCACGAVAYALGRAPMITHCCHCRQCQRETGASFALNAMIERSELSVTGPVTEHRRPSGSGKGITAAICPACATTLWTVYGVSGDAFAWVRVGTLDDPNLCPPSVHIFTEFRQPWLTLPGDVPSYPAFYPPREVWSPDAMARRKAALG